MKGPTRRKCLCCKEFYRPDCFHDVFTSSYSRGYWRSEPHSENNLNAASSIRSRIDPAGYVFWRLGLGDLGFVFLISDIFTWLWYEGVPFTCQGSRNAISNAHDVFCVRL